MNKLSFYEQVGIVIPGSVFLFGRLTAMRYRLQQAILPVDLVLLPVSVSNIFLTSIIGDRH